MKINQDYISNEQLSILKNGIKELGLEANEEKFAKLIQYVALLLKWNKVYSLTAITQVDEIIYYHILDGLTLIKHLQLAKMILDVGSGMGVPGVIIAIYYPSKIVNVVDSNGKKATFLRQVAIELKLKNLQVIHEKVENLPNFIKYDTVVSRAFTSATDLIKLTLPILENAAVVILMKSSQVVSEIDEINQQTNINKYELLEVQIPTVVAKRYLLKLYVH